jgi:ATP-binding cassette subfamily B protein
MRLGERAGMVMQRRLGELAAAIPTIEHFERPDYLKEVDLVRRDSGWLADAFTAMVHHASAIAQLALTVGLLAALHPLLVLLPLFGIPSLVASGQVQRVRQRTNEAVVEGRKLERHLQDLTWSGWPAKELRIFGLADELVRRHERVREATDRVEDRAGLKAVVVTTAGWLAFAVGFVGAIAFVVGEAVAGRATTGDVVLALALAGQMNARVASLANTVTWAAHGLAVAGRYLWLTEYAERAARRELGPAPVPDRLQEGITLEDVSFVYPGTERRGGPPVLANVSLHLPAGSTVAVVGENGAGKTTLVKLLCRLYDPSPPLGSAPPPRLPGAARPRGRILVDGIDLRRLDPGEWRARTSAGFQDFARFMFLVRESVGVGEMTQVEDATAVAAALKRAHAGDVVAGLPRGLETQLGRYFLDGIGLSDGQWQKLALGRAMMRPTPLLLVLDEPTAALDAPSEHALFERYAGAARRAAAANGGITVLVSHRFSTVRMADLIVVMEAGRVVAVGSHGDLMAQGGLYAELYELQARAYRT